MWGLTFIRVFSDNSGTTNVIVPSMSVMWHTDGHVQTRASGSLSRRNTGSLLPAGGATVSEMLARLLHAWNCSALHRTSDNASVQQQIHVHATTADVTDLTRTLLLTAKVIMWCSCHLKCKCINGWCEKDTKHRLKLSRVSECAGFNIPLDT